MSGGATLVAGGAAYPGPGGAGGGETRSGERCLPARGVLRAPAWARIYARRLTVRRRPQRLLQHGRTRHAAQPQGLHQPVGRHRRGRGDRRRGRHGGGGPRRGGRPAPRRRPRPAEHVQPARAGHHRPARARPELGLLHQRRVRRRDPQRRRPGQDRHPRRGRAHREGPRPHPADRRGRHHPGHPALVLLRPGRADHRPAQGPPAPDGAGHEPHALRRGRARQPRVQLRHPAAARLPGPVRLPAAGGERRGRDHAAARLPAVPGQGAARARRPARQGRHPRPDQPGHRGLGQGQRAGPDGLPRPGRAGEDLRAEAARARLRRGHLHRPLRPGRQHLLRRHDPVPGERLVAGRRAGAGHRRDPGRPHPRRAPADPGHQRGDRQDRGALRAADVGHAAERLRHRPGVRARPLAGHLGHRRGAQRQHRRTRTRSSPSWSATSTRRSWPTSTRSSAPAPRRCRRPSRRTRTPRSSTSSTWCSPTP